MNPPSTTYLIDSYRFSWPEEEIDILCDRIHEERDGLKCEMTVSTSRTPFAGLLREGRINLSSTTTRAQWVKDLNGRMADIDWYAAFEQVCALSIRRWREGDPLVDLSDVDVPDDLPYLLHPLVIEGAASVLFADGASGKSLVALACAVSVATGLEIIPGVEPLRKGPVIYWDWEWDAESHAERLQAVCNGAGIDVPKGMILYQRELTSAIEAMPRMRKRVAETGTVFVVSDSLGFARGGEPNSADLTMRMFGAFRTLQTPILALDHVAKAMKGESDNQDSFGSIYTRNSARIMWRLDAKKEEGQNAFYAGLTNTKANRKTQRARGLKIELETDQDERLLSVHFEATNIADIPGMNKAVSLRDQIAIAIKSNRGMHLTPADIAKFLDVEGISTNENVVRAILNRHKDMFLKMGDGWTLKSDRVEA